MSSKATAAKVSQSNDLFGPDYAESSSHRAPAQDEGVEKQDPGLEEEEEEEDATENANVNDGEIPGEDEIAANQLEDLYESESPSDSGTDSLTWIGWFCSLPGHEYFAEVSEDFIEDDFNLTGLVALVPFYKEALEMILDVEPQEDSLKIPDVSIVESSAELLYGLIHQRYILTRQGLQQMVDKYENGHFGFCPRVFCHSHPVLPCGRSDLPGLDTVKLFCANCIDNYSPPSSRFHGVDGAFFGTTFPHLLFQTYRELAPSPIAPAGTNFASLNTQSQPQGLLGSNGTQRTSSNSPMESVAQDSANGDPAQTGAAISSLASTSTLQPELLGRRTPQARLYTPRIYGFRVSEHAKSGPRMRWMRMRPESFEELDQGVVRVEPSVRVQEQEQNLNEQDQKAGDFAVTDETRVGAEPSITAEGRSSATGRLMAGRNPNTQIAGEGEAAQPA